MNGIKSRKPMVERFKVKNFKSLEDIDINLNKVNLFLGGPNTGKSNLLEVIGFISAIGNSGYIRNFLRLEEYQDLYFKRYKDRDIKIEFDFDHRGNANPEFNALKMSYDPSDGIHILAYNDSNIAIFADRSISKEELSVLSNSHIPESARGQIDTYSLNGHVKNSRHGFLERISRSEGMFSRFKFYRFFNFRLYQLTGFESMKDDHGRDKNVKTAGYFTDSILPFGGTNIYHIVKSSEQYQLLLRDILKKFKLKLVINSASERLEVQEEDDGIVMQYRLSSLADTIKSLIFHSLVIKSNNNSIITLEEPEIHTFPSYSRYIAEMIAEDTSNQFLITSHNTHFVNTIIQKTLANDLQIFIVQKEGMSTNITPVQNEQLSILYENDLFSAVKQFDEWKDRS